MSEDNKELAEVMREWIEQGVTTDTDGTEVVCISVDRLEQWIAMHLAERDKSYQNEQDDRGDYE